MANLITLARFLLLVIMALDGLDGCVARRRGETEGYEVAAVPKRGYPLAN